MGSRKGKNTDNTEDCVIHDHPVPPEQLSRYSVERDPYSESDIASYVKSQVSDESIQHVERVKKDVVLGYVYETWDVTTDKDRWWVITNLTNLYSQKYFPSLDYTLSFHIGLMMRIRDRSNEVDVDDPSPFDEVLRREEQAEKRHANAIEAEDYQAVGMLLREALIALISSLRRRINIPKDIDTPQDSNFILWSVLLMDLLCGGSSNKSLRQHLKNIAKETWQLVNWLTHAKNADNTASSIAIHSCQIVIGHFIQMFERNQVNDIKSCPVCKSRNIRSHFDISIGEDGEYFTSCGVCNWSDRPDVTE